jgi:hypothetical protein
MSEAQEGDLYAMVNLVPRMTGLPMTGHAMPRGHRIVKQTVLNILNRQGEGVAA